MMQLTVIGINHKIAPIDVREHFYLSSIQQELLLSELKCDPNIFEVFVVSTCNRTEIYLNHIFAKFDPTYFLKLIAQVKDIDFKPSSVEHFYVKFDNCAISHLFQVICGLDSLVIGEKQILGQMKKGFELAQRKGTFSKYFNILSSVAIRAGKKAHSATQISCGGSSVSWAAITTAEKELGSLEGKTLLILGAGKMSALTVGQINQKKFGKLYLINRTQENAELLAKKYTGTAISFCDIKDVFSEIDVCICATDAPHYILDYSLVEKAQKKSAKEKIILIDISMPRNIDPRVSLISNVRLYHIDDLKKPIEAAMNRRKMAILDVEKIIQKKILEFHQKINKSGVFDGDLANVPTPSN